jgi:hypothetical protein
MFYFLRVKYLFRRLHLVCAGLLLAGSAQAAPITYIFSGVTDGVLDGRFAAVSSGLQFFNPSQFKITANADTTSVTAHPLVPPSNVAYAVANQSVTIDVAGLGLFNLIDPGYTQLFTSNQVVLIGQLTQAPYFVGQTFAATSYDLRNSLAESTLNVTDRSVFYTDRGVLVLRDKFDVFDGKFSANFAAVPTPGTLCLLTSAIFVTGLVRRRTAPQKYI